MSFVALVAILTPSMLGDSSKTTTKAVALSPSLQADIEQKLILSLQCGTNNMEYGYSGWYM